jgi:hypothetical protein
MADSSSARSRSRLTCRRATSRHQSRTPPWLQSETCLRSAANGSKKSASRQTPPGGERIRIFSSALDRRRFHGFVRVGTDLPAHRTKCDSFGRAEATTKGGLSERQGRSAASHRHGDGIYYEFV